MATGQLSSTYGSAEWWLIGDRVLLEWPTVDDAEAVRTVVMAVAWLTRDLGLRMSDWSIRDEHCARRQPSGAVEVVPVWSFLGFIKPGDEQHLYPVLRAWSDEVDE